MREQLPLRLAIPTVLLYAAGYPIGAATVAVMAPFLVIALRFTFSALTLWAICAVLWRRLGLTWPPRRQLVHVAIAGLLTQAVQFLGLYWGLSHGVASGLASLIIALNPVATATLLAVFFRHRESRTGLLALALATGAVVLACLPKLMADARAGAAVLFVVLAMHGLALGGIHQARRCQGVHVLLFGAIGLTVSTPFAWLLTLTGPQPVRDWPRAIALLVAMVILTSVAATTLYAQCVRRAGARGASILFAIIPAMASLMAWLALGERLSGLTLAALALGAGACVLQARAAAQSAAPSP